MIAPLIVLTLFTVRGQAPQTPIKGPPVKIPAHPVIPAGASPEFFQTAGEVHASLVTGDFEAATRRIRLLPNRNVTYGWDDSQIPFEFRNGYADARDAAMARWSTLAVTPTFTEKASPLVQFRFAKSLGVDPTTGIPKAAAVLFRNGVDPRMECVISLKRGQNGAATTGIEIQNEVNYALALYFGLAPSPLMGTAASRSDLPLNRATAITSTDINVYKGIQSYVDALKGAVKKENRWKLLLPNLFVDPIAGAAPDTEEGGRARFAFQISNSGTGPLSYRTAGDCGCVIAAPPGVIPAGGSVVIRPQIDTTDFRDLLDHRLILYTNDPNEPIKSLPIRVKVLPRYAWTDPNNGVVVMQGDHEKVNFKVDYANARKLDWTQARLDGGEGTVTPKIATSADRTHVDVSVDIAAPLNPGRVMMTLTVPSIDGTGGMARYSFSVQKGIAALPSDVYMGTLAGEPKMINFMISRPGKPFKITRISSDLPWLKITVADSLTKDEYRVSVKYDGGAPVGEIMGVITILTDDPKQPTIKMPVSGARV